MKNMNYLVNYMVYASLLGKSLFLAFGKGFFVFCKIFTPDFVTKQSFRHNQNYAANQKTSLTKVVQFGMLFENLT